MLAKFKKYENSGYYIPPKFNKKGKKSPLSFFEKIPFFMKLRRELNAQNNFKSGKKIFLT